MHMATYSLLVCLPVVYYGYLQYTCSLLRLYYGYTYSLPSVHYSIHSYFTNAYLV